MLIFRDKQNSVACGNSKQRDKSDYRRNADHIGSEIHRQHAANQRQQQIKQYDSRQSEVFELAVQQQENNANRQQRSNEQRACGVCRALELSAVLNAVAFGQFNALVDILFNVFHYAFEVAPTKTFCVAKVQSIF